MWVPQKQKELSSRGERCQEILRGEWASEEGREGPQRGAMNKWVTCQSRQDLGEMWRAPLGAVLPKRQRSWGLILQLPPEVATCLQEQPQGKSRH